MSRAQRSAVFLDRDGVLNVDDHYVSSPRAFRWIAGAPEAIRHINEAGYLAVVVTNQSGIARGYYTEMDFNALHRWIAGQLESYGAHIDEVYFCPHLPEAAVPRYRCECQCRKPLPGMLLRAMSELDIDPSSSLLIGDRESDGAAARSAGVDYHMFTGPDLYDFVRQIVNHR